MEMGDLSGWPAKPLRVFAGLFLYRERGPPSRESGPGAANSEDLPKPYSKSPNGYVKNDVTHRRARGAIRTWVIAAATPLVLSSSISAVRPASVLLDQRTRKDLRVIARVSFLKPSVHSAVGR
jgi:hypothetical protein